jgi:deoxycytidine triphosphate deaminase
MVLSKPEIIARIEAGRVDPSDYQSLSFSPAIGLDAIDQCSIDLRVEPFFSTFKQKDYIGSFNLRSAKEMLDASELWDNHPTEEWELKPGQFVLTRTLESVHLPNDLMGLVEGRSSYARFGVGIHITAPKIDPGYNNRITLELTNHSKAAYKIIAGVNGISLSQLILVKLSAPLAADQIRGAVAGKDLTIAQATTSSKK